MVSTAGANKNAILSGLITLLKEVATFEERVYKGYRTLLKKYPSILVHFAVDDISKEASDEDFHAMTVNVLVKDTANVKGNAETQMEEYIELVGLVEDKLKGNTYNAGVWEDMGPFHISYTFGQRDRVIYYSALIKVRVEAQW